MALTKEEIKTGNEIIALFMDGVYYEAWGNPEYNCHFPHFYFKHEETLDRKVCGDPKYHSSWDWLMPVVKKINDLFGGKSRELSNRSREQEHLEDKLDNPLCWKSWSYHYINLSTDIDYVYKKVVSSIQWYNTQSTQQ